MTRNSSPGASGCNKSKVLMLLYTLVLMVFLIGVVSAELIPPTIIITSPENGHWYTSLLTQLSAAFSEAVSWVGYSLNGASNVTIDLNPFTNLCYQESANVSTTCGGLATGSYYGIVGVSKTAYDGDWETGETWTTGDVMWVNYTIPENVTSVKLSQRVANTYKNTSIDRRCWNYSNTLAIKFTWTSGGSGFITAYCMRQGDINPSQLIGTIGTPIFYEEGIIWNIFNGSISTNFTAAEGQNNLTLSFNDTSGNMNYTNLTFYTDTYSPTLSITYPLNTNYNINVSNLNYTYSDVGGAGRCWYSRNGGVINSTSVAAGINFTGITSVEGSNTWTLYCNDSVDNRNSNSVTFFKDTVFPLIEYGVGTPIDGSYLNHNDLFINTTWTEINFYSIGFTWMRYGAGASGVVSYTPIYSRNLSGFDLPDGLYYFNVTIVDIAGNRNFTTTRNVTIDTIIPVITITSPVGAYNTENVSLNISLNYSLIETNLANCSYSLDGAINVSLVSCSNSTITAGTGNHILIIYATDLGGNTNSRTTTFNIASFIMPGFTTATYETKLESFNITILGLNNILSIAANLIYKGVSYLGIVSLSEDNATITSNINIPLNTLNVQNNSFYWNILLYSATNTTVVNLTSHNQSVDMIHLAVCDTTYPTLTLNFTAIDADNMTVQSPFLFSGTFDYWLGGGGTYATYSFSNLSATEVNLCLSPNQTFYTNADISFGDGNINYYDGSYAFVNKSISNVPQAIPLLLTKKASSVAFILKVQDYTQTVIQDAYIQIERYYPGTDSYLTVSTVKTNENGLATSYFIPYTVDYRFTITKNGQTLLTTEKQKIIPQESPYTIIFTVGSLDNPIILMDDSVTVPGLVSSLSYNYTSKNVTYSYVDSNSTFQQGRLIVTLQNVTGDDSIICNVTSINPTAVLICDVSAYSGTITAKGFITRQGVEILDRIIVTDIINYANIFGKMGLFVGALIIISCGFMFLWNLKAGVVAINVGVILVNLTHLINFGYVFIFAMIAVSVVVILALGDG